MIRSLFAKAIAAPESPTADLYFMNACSDMLRSGVTRLAPTVFVSPCARLIMRHDLGIVRQWDGGRIVFFLDDAIEAGISDASLSFHYRLKLRLVERAAVRRYRKSVGAIVVSCSELARQIGWDVEPDIVNPYWSEPIAGQEHFDPLIDRRGWVDIAYLGGASHRGDLDFLWPVIGSMLAAYPAARFHLPECHQIRSDLSRHPRVLRIPGRGWRAYRAGLAQRRFHLALYPLIDTPFNRGRSLNKLIEHGVVGAAAVYSRSWSEAWRVRDTGAGLLLANDRSEWRAALEHLLASPEQMHRLATKVGALARALNKPAPQRRLWARLLGVDLNANL